MGRRADADRWAVVTWFQQGLKPADIVHKTGFCFPFVNRWIEHFKRKGTAVDDPRAGKKRKRTMAMEKEVAGLMRGKQRRSSRVVAQILKDRGIADVHYTTVQRAAHAQHLKPYRMQRSPRLTEAHKKDRLAFAKQLKNKDWSHTIFTDEHVFKQFKGANASHDIVWAKNPSEVPDREVERWSMTASVWAGISKQGKTPLHFYTGTLNALNYQEILGQSLLPAAQDLFGDGEGAWELQQDKATCHTARSTREWLEENDIVVLDAWPTKGDDINPMENLWAILDERLQRRRYTTLAGLKKVLREEWDLLGQNIIDNLIDSIPGRLCKIRKALGGAIKRVP